MTPPLRQDIERFLEEPADGAIFDRWSRTADAAAGKPAKGAESDRAAPAVPETSNSVRAGFHAFYQTVLAVARQDPQLCLRAIEHATQASSRAFSRRERALFQRLSAHVLVAAGRAGDAVPRYESAAGGFRRLADHAEEGRTATGWVFALGLCGRPGEVSKVARRGQRLLSPSDKVARARLESNVGSALQLCGRLEDAIDHYQAAERAFTRAGLDSDAAIIRHNRALLHRLRGARRPARRDLEQARAVFAETGQLVLQLYAETVLVSLDLEDGKWSDGLAELERLRGRFAELGDDRARAWLHRELGTLFTGLGAIAPALAETAEATALFDRLGLRLDAAHARTLEGRLLQAQGSRQEAFARLTSATQEWTRVSGTWAKHRANLEIARVLLDDGEVERASGLLRRAQRPLDRWDPHGDGALCRALSARGQLARGRFATAERLARQARATATRYPARLERPSMSMLLARVADVRGDGRAALRWSQRAIDELESLLLRLGDRATRLLVGESRESLYGAALELTLRHGGARANERALDLVSKARSPILVEDLLQNRSVSVDATTRAAIMRLRDELLSPGAGPEAEETRAVALKAELDRVARWVLRSEPRPPAIVRRALEERALASWRPRLHGRVLVLYDRTPQGWQAFRATESEVDRIDLPDLERVLATDWTSLRLNLGTASRLSRQRRREFLVRTEGASIERLQKLEAAAWAPLAIDDRPAVVVPFGSLHSVPFESFTDQPGCEISRLPHPALLRKKRPRSPGRALLLHGAQGGPRKEITVIARQLRAAGLQVATSSQRRALESSEPVDVLHVAAHGAYHRDAWLLSGIELEDGWVGFEHLRSTLVRGALLNFTSCESGLAEQMPGSDTEGWITAGLSAGAAAMVLALWKIDDAAALAFSKSFYAGWLRGLTAAQAAQQARAATRKAHPHPYHWAAFSIAE